MSTHSYNKIWIHFIWETLDKQKILSKPARLKLSAYLSNYVNPDHVHALIDLPTNITVEDCVKLLKGSSSHHINKNKLINTKFSWGRGYGAFSVSASQLKKVETYIKNQQEHHRVKSFTEEYEIFIKKYGLKYVKNG